MYQKAERSNLLIKNNALFFLSIYSYIWFCTDVPQYTESLFLGIL